MSTEGIVVEEMIQDFIEEMIQDVVEENKERYIYLNFYYVQFLHPNEKEG